jgi:hypothetical protein
MTFTFVPGFASLLEPAFHWGWYPCGRALSAQNQTSSRTQCSSSCNSLQLDSCRSKAKVLGFVNTRLVPSHDTFSVQFDGLQPIPLASQPCVTALLRAIDCPKCLELRPSALGIYDDADTPSTCSVGTIFTDLLMSVVTNLKISEMPYLMARSWLEMLIIFILKVCIFIRYVVD